MNIDLTNAPREHSGHIISISGELSPWIPILVVVAVMGGFFTTSISKIKIQIKALPNP
jgi:hypothetical protein